MGGRGQYPQRGYLQHCETSWPELAGIFFRWTDRRKTTGAARDREQPSDEEVDHVERYQLIYDARGAKTHKLDRVSG